MHLSFTIWFDKNGQVKLYQNRFFAGKQIQTGVLVR